MPYDTDKRASLTANINSYKDLREALRLLEEKFDVRIALLTRDDVNNEFSQSHEFDGDGAKDMTDAQWEKFTRGWLWSEGYLEVMLTDAWQAIRMDLLNAGLIPKTAVV